MKNKSTAESLGVDRERSTTSSRSTAGRELDARIATLMGYRAFRETRGEYTLSIWRKPGERDPWEDFRNPVVERSRFAEVTCEDALKIGFFGQGFPRFSMDVAAAMEIFPRLRAKGWVYLTVQSVPYRADVSEWDDKTMLVEWWAEFSRYRSPVEVTSPHCETPALAICLAALETVGA